MSREEASKAHARLMQNDRGYREGEERWQDNSWFNSPAPQK